MRIRWRNLELPTKVVADSATRTDTYAKFTAEPFERGYGVTVGNGLRRVLLSSIEGTAVTSVKIPGVKHEFSSIEGVKEDVTDIVLALKRLRVRFFNDDPKVLRIEKQGPGIVTGADVQTTSDCEVIDKDLVICNVTTDRVFECELEVRKGRGYITAEENARDEMEIGVIPTDSIFSPVQRVRYRTENTRVGKMTNYDRLILELWTDGTVTPEMALVEASKIYRKHLNPFIQLFDVGKELAVEPAAPVVPVSLPPVEKSPLGGGLGGGLDGALEGALGGGLESGLEGALGGGLGGGSDSGAGGGLESALESALGGGLGGGLGEENLERALGASIEEKIEGALGGSLEGTLGGVPDSAVSQDASEEEEEEEAPQEAALPTDSDALSPGETPTDGVEEATVAATDTSREILEQLERPIAHMDLSVRASNCLESEGIQTIGELVAHPEDDLLKFKNFGRTSLKEIKKKLDDMGLSLGMDLGAVRSRKE